MANYYVNKATGINTNNGDFDHPWASIAHAISNTGTAAGLGAGDTVYIFDDGGSYTVRLDCAVQGASGQYFTLESYPGESPVIDLNGVALGNTTSTCNALYFYNKSYIKVKGLEIKNWYPVAVLPSPPYVYNNSLGYPDGILFRGDCHHTWVEDCYIHHGAGEAIQYRFSTVRVDGAFIKNVETYFTNVYGSGESISGDELMANVEVSYCYVHDVQGQNSTLWGDGYQKEGINFGGTLNSRIHHNVVDNASTGIYIAGNGDGAGAHMLVDCNVLINILKNGISVASENYSNPYVAKTNAYIDIINNIIIGEANSSSYFHAINIGFSTWPDDYNHINVINNTAYNFKWMGLYIQPVGICSNNVARNNIFYSLTNGSYGISNGEGSAWTIDHNCYHITTGSFADAARIAAESGAVADNPDFVDIATESDSVMVAGKTATFLDFHLQVTSPCRDAGLATLAPLIDFDGSARSSPDIGAFEYGGTPPPPEGEEHVQVSAGSDDGDEAGTGAMTIDWAHVWVVSNTTPNSKKWLAAVLSLSGTIPQSAIIDTCVVAGYLDSTTYDDFNCKLYFQKAAAPATLTTDANNITSRSLTTAYVDVVADSVGIGWYPINAKTPLQETVNAYAISKLCVVLVPNSDSNKNASIRSNEYTGNNYGLKVDITYRVGGTSYQVSGQIGALLRAADEQSLLLDTILFQPDQFIAMALIDEYPVTLLKDTININKSLGSRFTGSFTIIDLNGTETYADGQMVQVYSPNFHKVFAGIVQNPESCRMFPSGGRLWDITFIDWHYLADKRIAAATYLDKTAGYIVNDLFTDYLADEGVTLGQIDEGPTISETAINYVKVSDAFDSLAELSGYIWFIDNLKRLYFVNRSTNTAPWNITDTLDIVGTPKLNFGNPKYRNRQYIRGIIGITDTQTETRIGDGETQSFAVGFPIAKVPMITVGGLAQTIGIKGLDSDKDWYWSKSDPVIYADSAPADGIDIVVQYQGEYNLVTRSEDKHQISIRQFIEGGTGYVEHIEDRYDLTSLEAAFDIAASLLGEYSTDHVKSFTFNTYREGLEPGQIITITYPILDLSAEEFLITSVDITEIENEFLYTVTAVIGPDLGSWSSFFKKLNDKRANVDKVSIGSDSTVVILEQNDEGMGLTEAVDEDIYSCSVPAADLYPAEGLLPC